MTSPPDDNENLSPETAAIIEMMKRQNLQAQQQQTIQQQLVQQEDGVEAQEKKHAFWDTQVR